MILYTGHESDTHEFGTVFFTLPGTVLIFISF